MGPSQTHVYTQPGSYLTELTVTDTNGNIYSATHTVHAFASVDNTSVIVPNGALFFDDFDYVAARDDANIVSVFQNQGWNWAKTAQDPNSNGPKGYLYTTTRIPGYSGPFPGSNSSRVLALEALPATFGGQTDFYLEYAGASNESIPGDVWFQFWVYPNYHDDPADQEDQLSEFGDGFKFIYPCRGQYPCQDASWLFTMGASSSQPLRDNLGLPSHDVYMGASNFRTATYLGGTANLTYGQTDISERPVRNRWTLVKIHFDTASSSGRYEAWLKPLGGEWVKVSEWIDGANDFTWPINNPGGHSVFRMPTTYGRASQTDLFDSWIYMDDFTMANSESDLPVYPY